MESFKEYMSQFEDEIRAIFFEMAHAVKERIPIFDDDDKVYYKYILDQYLAKTPESMHDDANLISLLRQALELRYGRKSKEPSGKGGNGRVVRMAEEGEDEFNHTFNVGKKMVEIKNIPMYPQKIIKKAIASGWFPEDISNPIWNIFGKGFGPLNSPLDQRGSGRWKAAEYLRYFRQNIEPSAASAHYDPMSHAKKTGASREDQQNYLDRVRQGRAPRKKGANDQQRSMETIPLDKDDEEYLESIKQQFIEKYGDFYKPRASTTTFSRRRKDSASQLFLPFGANPEVPQEVIDRLFKYALTVRYSGHWIRQDEDGSFHVRDKYKDRQNPEGLMVGPVTINMSLRVDDDQGRLKRLEFDGVQLNLPALAKKFYRYRFANNFVKDPWEGQAGLQAAERFLARKGSTPWQGSEGGTVLTDNKFFHQISKDHDSWRHSGEPVRGGEVADQELAAKLTWRRNGMIVESPNISDVFRRRDANKFTWQNLIEDDAKRAMEATVKFLGGRRYANYSTFSDWASKSDTREGMLQDALVELTTKKTGVWPDKTGKSCSTGYRHESCRLRWCNDAVARYIKEHLPRAAGKGKDDEEGGIDAPGSETGDTVNTGVAHHRGEEERDDLVPTDIPTDVPEPERDPDDPTGITTPQDWADYLKQLNAQSDTPKAPIAAHGTPRTLAAGLPTGRRRPLPRPPSIPQKQWILMSPDEKTRAAREAGLIT